MLPSRHPALRLAALPLRGAVSACALAWLVAGCAGSPLPEPPTLVPEAIAVAPSDCESCDQIAFDLRGSAGAVTPGADVLFTDLDGSAPALVIAAEADGSFAVRVLVVPGDEVRIQPRLDGRYGAPLEIVATPGSTTLLRAERPLAGCFVVTPTEARMLAPGERTSVRIDNRCTTPITVSRAAPRSDALGLVVEGLDPPLELGVGVQRALQVTAPSTAGAGEELVLIETEVPVRDRRSVLIVVAP